MASDDFSRALTIDPRQTWALLGRAEIHSLQGNSAESLQDYRQLLDSDPLCDIARQRMTALAIRTAKKYIAARRWAQAAHTLDSLLGSEPVLAWVSYQAEAYLLRSRVRRALHRRKEALEDLNTLLTALPSHAETLHERGKLHENLGRSHEAMSDFEHACTLGLKEACRSSS
jgi:tetratricopeptide (TPR) repeat protein